MLHNKKGIELSVNFLIVIILGLVVLGFGLKFSYDALHKAEDLRQLTQAELDAKMEAVACENAQMVCIGDNTKEARIGDLTSFTVVVFNTQTNEQTFTIDVKPNKTYDANEMEITGVDTSSWIINQPTFSLSPNQKHTSVVGILVDTDTANLQKGRYVFTLEVKTNGQVYGPQKKLYVQVI